MNQPNNNGCGCLLLLLVIGVFTVIIIRNIHAHKERMYKIEQYETTNLRSSDPR